MELPVMPTKICNICLKAVPLIEFFRNTSSKDGHGYSCKTCSNVETQYRNMQTKYRKHYQRYLERHRMLAKRYQRLIMGMTPREAIVDEIRGREEE